MNRKPLVLVVCGAGTLTSVIASQGVEQGLKKRGITDVEIKVGRLDDIGRYADRITVLVASMNIRQKYDFPRRVYQLIGAGSGNPHDMLNICNIQN